MLYDVLGTEETSSASTACHEHDACLPLTAFDGDLSEGQFNTMHSSHSMPVRS